MYHGGSPTRVTRSGAGVVDVASVLRVERKPAPVRAQVLDNLRQAIMERQLAPGQRLIERELVELTGVSRTSIREALRELAAEGLVTAIPNKGTIVARVSVLRSLSMSVPGRPAESVAEMRAIVDAVLAGDAEAAARACSRHVEEAGRVALQAL